MLCFPSPATQIFAIAPVRKNGPQAAEKVTDSSRYFCLRIENDKGALTVDCRISMGVSSNVASVQSPLDDVVT